MQENFDDLLSSLRWSIMTINSTRVDISLAKGFQSWIVSFISYFKEWVGVGMFGTVLCYGIVFLLWMVC